MRTAFFTWITENFRDTIIDFQGFYKSFKRFHPDIDLIVFNDEVVRKVFDSQPWLNSCTCKAAFAKLLYDDYDLLINVDSDFYFFDRCEDILKGNYELACCANYNTYYNVRLAHANQNINGYNIPDINEEKYVQGGLVASTRKDFWDDYYTTTEALESFFPLKENDTLNVLYHLGKYQTKVFDGDYRFDSSNFTQFFNCASLGKERSFKIKDDRIFCDDKPVRSYHVARGNNGKNGFAKPRPNELFEDDVVSWFESKIRNVV